MRFQSFGKQVRLQQLVWAMMDYYKNDASRISHFMLVYTLVDWISEEESLEEELRYLLAVLALTHDVGTKAAIKKYGRSNTELQEREGPPVAHDILKQFNFSPELISRVCQVIGRHHTYEDIDGIDCQILMEAEILANIHEGHEGMPNAPHEYSKLFITRTGRKLFSKMCSESSDTKK